MNHTVEQSESIKMRIHALVDLALSDLDVNISPGKSARTEEVRQVKELALLVAGNVRLNQAIDLVDRQEINRAFAGPGLLPEQKVTTSHSLPAGGVA